MATELLLQILYGVLVIAGVVLISVLWRVFEVLSDFKDISVILVKRIREIDQTITKAEDSAVIITEVLKGFVHSLGMVKTIKGVMDDNKNKGK